MTSCDSSVFLAVESLLCGSPFFRAFRVFFGREIGFLRKVTFRGIWIFSRQSFDNNSSNNNNNNNNDKR